MAGYEWRDNCNGVAGMNDLVTARLRGACWFGMFLNIHYSELVIEQGILILLTSSMAVDSGLASPHDILNCHGRLKVVGSRLLDPECDILAGLLNGLRSAHKHRGTKKATGDKL